MSGDGTVAALAFVFVVVACSPAVVLQGEFSHARPQIVGFARPDIESSSEPGAAEALAHLQFAVADAASCLDIEGLSTSIVFQSEVVVHYGNDRATCRLSDGEAGDSVVGAVLIDSARPPVCIFAPAGASSLHQAIPDAAAEYFGRPDCGFEL